jgi:hypothetical protein
LPPAPQTVTTFEESFAFADDFLRRLGVLFGDHPAVLRFLKYQIENLTVSTCFSGIDSPGTADHMMAAALGNLLGETVRPPHHVAACERDPHCRSELSDHPARPDHLFVDVESFKIPAIRDELTSGARIQAPSCPWNHSCQPS